jgi:antitoxin YefM
MEANKMNIDSYVPITRAKAKLLDMVREIHDRGGTIAITKNGVPKAVMISMEQWESTCETIAILADEKAMKQLRSSIRDEKMGKPFIDLEDLE